MDAKVNMSRASLRKVAQATWAPGFRRVASLPSSPGSEDAAGRWLALRPGTEADRNDDGLFCREVGMTVMTKELAPQGGSYGPDDDIDGGRDHPFFADPAEVTAETYPSLRNISAGFAFKRVARALEPAPAEYVTLPLEGGISDAGHLVAVAKWNLLWESGCR